MKTNGKRVLFVRHVTVAFVFFWTFVSVLSLEQKNEKKGLLSFCGLVHDQHRVKKITSKYVVLSGSWAINRFGSTLAGPARIRNIKKKNLNAQTDNFGEFTLLPRAHTTLAVNISTVWYSHNISKQSLYLRTERVPFPQVNPRCYLLYRKRTRERPAKEDAV